MRWIDLRCSFIQSRFLLEEGAIHIAKLRAGMVVFGILQLLLAMAFESCCTLLRKFPGLAGLPFVLRGRHDGLQLLSSLSLHLMTDVVPGLGILE